MATKKKRVIVKPRPKKNTKKKATKKTLPKRSVKKQIQAKKPTTDDGKQYHTHTGKGDVSPLCILVGAPGRVKMIAGKFLKDCTWFYNDHRGLATVTGYYLGVRISVSTTGMGGDSTGIVLPELARSGARLFIRVGTCGSMVKKSKIGDAIIVTSAIRRDGASISYAPIEFPANADYRVIYALVEAAKKIAPDNYHLGEECTTSDFNGGQGRPDLYGRTSKRMKEQHEEVMALGTACYSMEASTIFAWSKYVALGILAGAINAVVANRRTDKFGVKGEELAARIALKALVWLSKNADTMTAINKLKIKY